MSRLELMIRKLSLQVTTINQRLDSNSTGDAQTQSFPQSENTQASGQPYTGSYSNWNYRLPPHKWNVKFSGDKGSKMTASDFLNILALKRDAHDVTWELIGAHFDNLLEGRALNWYYMYRKRNPQTEWSTLKEAFCQHFSRRETDEEIMVKIANRRQYEKESFDEFCDAMTDLRNQLTIDYSDEQMIGLLRNNCKLGIRQMLATYSPSNLNDFVDKGKDKLLGSSSQQVRRIHEVQTVVPFPIGSSDYSSEIQGCLPQLNPIPMVEAFRNSHSQNLKCWNCDEVGHGFVDCEKERSLFCYKCGYKNVTCRNCVKCKIFGCRRLFPGNLQPHRHTRSRYSPTQINFKFK